MTGDNIVALIGIFLGAGGIGGAIVTAVANRKKIQADCVAALSNAYETRLNALGERITEVENENKLLKKEIDELKSALMDSDLTNVTLQKENAELQEQIDKLSKLVNNKDKRIRELEKQVAELTSRIDAMSGDDANN